MQAGRKHGETGGGQLIAHLRRQGLQARGLFRAHLLEHSLNLRTPGRRWESHAPRRPRTYASPKNAEYPSQ